MDYTDLYIHGEWRKTSDRFDVINPATEEVLASVASADIADADAALDAAERAMADWAARKPRERSEVLRKAWELMTERLDHFAHLITLENGKAGTDAKGEATYAAEFFRWFAEEAVRADGLITHAPASGARIVVQHKPAGLAVLMHAVELPRRHGHAEDRAGARRGLRRDHQARLRDAADNARPHAAAGGGRRAQGSR